MMHLRAITPTQMTDAAIKALLDEPAVSNLIVHPGAARSPRGDVIICDVAREAASDVLARLQKLGVDREGALALDDVAVSLSRGGDRAEKAAPGAGSDAVIWEQIEQRTGDESRLSPTFLIFFAIATIIAGFGVLLDQPILIVGAMVVGPEFGPLAALSVGIVRRRAPLIRRSLLALAVGFAVGMACTVLSTLMFDALGLIDRSMLLADRPLTDFIWRPDALSWVVGFLAGIAGMLSLTTAKSGALVGVLISVTTVPAAANAAVAITYGVEEEAIGSVIQLLLNLSAIIVAGVLTLLVQRLAASRRDRRRSPDRPERERPAANRR